MGVSKNICSHVKRRLNSNLASFDQKSAQIIDFLVMPLLLYLYHLSHSSNAIKYTSFSAKPIIRPKLRNSEQITNKGH